MPFGFDSPTLVVVEHRKGRPVGRTASELELLREEAYGETTLSFLRRRP